MSTFGNSDLDNFEMDGSGFDEEATTPSAGGAACNKAGHYHVHVKDVKMEGAFEADAEGKWKSPCIRLDLEILAGTEADQVGKTIYHRMYLRKKTMNGDKCVGLEPVTEESQNRILRAAYALGLIDDDALGQKSVKVPWSQSPGCQAIVKVDESEDEYNGKKTTNYRIEWGNLWRPDHEDVKEIPKDQEALAMWGGGGSVSEDDIGDL